MSLPAQAIDRSHDVGEATWKKRFQSQKPWQSVQQAVVCWFKYRRSFAKFNFQVIGHQLEVKRLAELPECRILPSSRVTLEEYGNFPMEEGGRIEGI